MEALEEFDFDMAGQESVLDLPHHPHDDDEAPHLPLETPDVLEQAVVGEIPKKKKAKKKKAPDNPARTLKKLGNNKKKRKRDELSDLQRERLLAGAKQDAKEDFIEQRESILAQVPESAKAYFGQIGFSKWAKQSLPVLGVSPYQVPPGEVRESWLTMFHNLKRQDRLDTMSVLIYWYGAEDLGSCYGFIPRRNFVSYERGQAKKVHVLPEKTRKKIENGKKLNQEERNLQRALMEMEEDLELPPEERKRGIIDFPEVYDLIGMEDVDETMLNNDMEYYDDDDNDETNSTDPDEPSEPSAASVPKKKKKVKKEPVTKKAKKAKKEGPIGSMVEEVVKLEEPGAPEPQTEPVGVGNVDMDDFDMDEQSEGVDEDDDEKDDDYHVDGMERVEDENLDDLVGPPAKKPKKTKAAKVKKEEDDKPEAKKAPKKKKKSEATEKPKEPKDPKKVEQQEFKKCEKQHLPMLYALDDALQAEDTDQIKSVLTELAGVVDSFSAKFMEIYPWSAALKQTKALFQKKGVGLDHFTTVRNRFKEVYLAKKPNIPEDFNPKPKKRPKPASSGKETSTDQKLAAPRRASHSPPPKPKESKLTELSESSARSFKDTIDHVPMKNPKTAVSARSVKQEANPKIAVSARPVKQEANPKTAVSARPVKLEAKPPPTKLQPKKSFSLTDWKRNYNTDSTNKESTTTTSTTTTANVPTPSSAAIHRPLPAWLTDSSLEASAPKDDPRAFALEFLLQMASHFPKGKVSCHALAVSLEAAIYQWAYKIGGDWQARYWKKVHALVAAMMGKRKPGALIQLTLNGSFREPKDLVELDDNKLVASFEGQPVIL